MILQRYERAKDEFLEIQTETLRQLRALVPASDAEDEDGSHLTMDDENESVSHEYASISSDTSQTSTPKSSVSSDSVLSSVIRDFRYLHVIPFWKFLDDD